MKTSNTTANFGSVRAMSDLEIEDMLKKMGDEIAKMPRRKVRLPADPLNPKEPRECGLNGYYFKIPCGVDVELPEPIIEIFEHAGVL